MPDAWHEQLKQGLSSGEADMQRWWEIFNDPVLSNLIDEAAASNLDLREAVWRIEQSRASVNFVAGRHWPSVLGIGAYNRLRSSENGIIQFDPGQKTNLHNLGATAAWEIDLFGRVSRSVESSKASFEASIEDYRDVLVSLYAEVAANYVNLKATELRIQYAKGNLETQSKTVQLTNNRLDAGLVPLLDVKQAELNLANTESIIPTLEIIYAQTVNRLAVLLARNPDEIYEMLDTKELPDLPGKIIVGLPAELLRQRPDIRKAERELAAQTAKVGIATAELYPVFSLTGSFELQATDLSDMDDMGSRKWGFGPSFRWNLFQGNRVRSNIEIEEAITAQRLASYENTVLLALEEVENSMVAFVQEKMRTAILVRSVEAAQKSVELVQERYVNGLTDFQNVLDMERELFLQQDRLAESQGLANQNIVGIYKALGGGWSVDDPIEVVGQESNDQVERQENE
jgi:multidrug efflux system outer membrane protein